MTSYQIENMNILEWCKEYEGPKFHALLCDPPYHLVSITKRFGDEDSKAAQYGKDGAFQRVSKGFMQTEWDGLGTNGKGIAFDSATWMAIGEHLYPGAFCFIFASSRGWHRLAIAIEDAGFIMHPTLWNYWCYGSGFPKATRIDTQIDKAAIIDCPNCLGIGFILSITETWEEWIAKTKDYGGSREEFERLKEPSLCFDCEGTGKVKGAEREIIGLREDWQKRTSSTSPTTGWRTGKREINITAPATPEAAQWEGHRYGLQALKPAIEPILCFQKPYEGRPLDSITITGAGALNIDGGRIGVDEDDSNFRRNTDKTKYKPKGWKNSSKSYLSNNNLTTKGRWPSNFILSHSPSCERVGVKRVKTHWGQPTRGTRKNSIVNVGPKDDKTLGDSIGYADPDGNETVEDWCCVDDCPVAMLDKQSGDRDSGGPSRYPNRYRKDSRKSTGIYGDYGASKISGFGDSGGASRFFFQSHFAYEIAEQIAAADPVRYVAKAGQTERNAGLNELPNQVRHRVNAGGLENEPRWSPIETKNIHPTVKPIALTKYLASLLLPPEAYAPRRVLVPFAGSGSEMIGALLAGWDEITGIEMTQKYIPIANARLAWWMHYLKWGQADIDAILKTVNQDDDRQLSFLEGLE